MGTAASLLQDPAVMAALQGKLGSMVGQASGYIQSLPAPVKKRIKALKKIQLEATKIEAQFYEEVHLLECKYHEKFGPLYAKRATITKGDYEPNEDTQALLTVDFEIGHYIRERIVPRAVLFFTGEALDDESDFEEEEDDDDDDDDGSGSDNDPDFEPKKAQANPECKQQ